MESVENRIQWLPYSSSGVATFIVSTVGARSYARVSDRLHTLHCTSSMLRNLPLDASSNFRFANKKVNIKPYLFLTK
jgi:hypothetical protein